MCPKLIIAHRGACEHAPENTMQSFQKAIELDADMIELDVRQTADRSLIVFHDDCINGQSIKEKKFSEVLDLGIQIGVEIPTFRQVLECCRGRIKLDIEIKEPGYEGEILALASRYLDLDNFILSSFSPISLEAVKKINPNCLTGIIAGKRQLNSYGFPCLAESPLRKNLIHPNSDLLIVHWKLLRPGFISRFIRRQNKSILVWTVNSRKKLLKYLNDDGISGIITDKPDLARLLAQETAPK